MGAFGFVVHGTSLLEIDYPFSMAYRRRSKYWNVGYWVNSPMELAFFSWIRATSFFLLLALRSFLSSNQFSGIVSVVFIRGCFDGFDTPDVSWIQAILW